MSKCYLISSDEILLKNEAFAQIIQSINKSNPEHEYMLFTSDELSSNSSGATYRLENEICDMGFFSSFKIIKIYLNDLDKTALKVFDIINNSSNDKLAILIDLPRVNSSYAKLEPKDPSKIKASKALDGQIKNALSVLKFKGCEFSILYPPDTQQLKSFISSRVKKYNIKITPQALDLLSIICEGNLLSIDQSLQLLNMANYEEQIDIDTINNLFVQEGKFSGFELAEAILEPNSNRALNILSSLVNSQGAESTLNLVLKNLDMCLECIYKAKEQRISFNAPYNQKVAFFAKTSFKSLKIQQNILKAANQMPQEILAYMSKTLAQASSYYATFNIQMCICLLKRLCICTSNLKIAKLKEL